METKDSKDTNIPFILKTIINIRRIKKEFQNILIKEKKKSLINFFDIFKK